jgi:hypothetical protein
MTSFQLKTQTIYCRDNLKMLKDLPEDIFYKLRNKKNGLFNITFFRYYAGE